MSIMFATSSMAPDGSSVEVGFVADGALDPELFQTTRKVAEPRLSDWVHQCVAGRAVGQCRSSSERNCSRPIIGVRITVRCPIDSTQPVHRPSRQDAQRCNHFPACARLFIDESYAVLEQVLKQAVEVAHGKTHLLNTGSALVENDRRVWFDRSVRSSILWQRERCLRCGTWRKSRGDALVRHGSSFALLQGPEGTKTRGRQAGASQCQCGRCKRAQISFLHLKIRSAWCTCQIRLS